MSRKKPVLANPYNLEYCELSPELVSGIGNIIREFAEIENIINLHISKLLNVGTNDVVVLLGRSGLRAKLEIARTLAQKVSNHAADLHDELFNDEWRYFVRARNALAHGALLGKCNQERLHFLTSNSYVHDVGSADLECLIYSEEQILKIPPALSLFKEILAEQFEVQSLLKAQRLGTLQVRQKNQTKSDC